MFSAATRNSLVVLVLTRRTAFGLAPSVVGLTHSSELSLTSRPIVEVATGLCDTLIRQLGLGLSSRHSRAQYLSVTVGGQTAYD